MWAHLRRHWPEYLIEAAGLGVFMISASVFATILQFPGSPVREALPDPTVRRLFMGLAMGGTAIAIIYSPWGRRSGAHINPGLTLTFLRLRKIEPPDALFYVIAQFAGGVAGILLARLALGALLADPAVNYAATLPGSGGALVALAAEFAISFLLMLVVLTVSNRTGWNRFTGVFAGTLVALYITLEDPLSGMSMNPARTFASTVLAETWSVLWIYFTAPPLGMLAAAAVHRFAKGAVYCAKLDHGGAQRCIFRCRFDVLAAAGS
jgi:aquaporin Z